MGVILKKSTFILFILLIGCNPFGEHNKKSIDSIKHDFEEYKKTNEAQISICEKMFEMHERYAALHEKMMKDCRDKDSLNNKKIDSLIQIIKNDK